MKRNSLSYKICTLVVAAATMLMGYSCQQEEFIYTPDSSACVTFQNVPATNFDLEGEDITIQIMRGNADNEATIDINLASGSIYTLENSSVTFAKNEFSKAITLSYDFESVEPFVEYPFELSFNSDLVSPSGKSTFKAIGMIPISLDNLEYVDYGTAYMECYMFGKGYAFAQKSTIQVAKYTKIYYRIKNLLGSGVDLDFTLTPDGVLEFTAPELSTPPTDVNSYDMFRFDTDVNVPPHVDGGVAIPTEWLSEKMTLWLDSDSDYWRAASYTSEGYTFGEGDYIQTYAVWNTPSAGLLSSDPWRPDEGTGDGGWWWFYINVDSVL